MEKQDTRQETKTWKSNSRNHQTKPDKNTTDLQSWQQWTKQIKNQKVLICCESVSAINSIGKGSSKSWQDLVYANLLAIRNVKRRGVEISFLWVPAHVGIATNEKVDKLAKEAALKENIDVNITLLKAEGKSIVWQETILKWQQLLEQEHKGRHLFSIASRVTDSVNICKRGGLVVGKRLLFLEWELVAHFWTALCLFSGLCSCQEPETVQHVLMSCRKYDRQRQELLRELWEIGLKEVSLKSILEVGKSRRGKSKFRDCYPLPRMEDCIDNLGTAEYISKLDLLKGYWQVPMTERASKIAAFVTPDHFLQYTVIVFGMCNDPATFQRLVNTVLAGLTNCNTYLDDLTIYTETWKEHVWVLEQVLSWLAQATLNITSYNILL